MDIKKIQRMCEEASQKINAALGELNRAIHEELPKDGTGDVTIPYTINFDADADRVASLSPFDVSISVEFTVGEKQ